MPWFIVAYIGPETILPLGSLLAAIGGLALMFWSYLRGAAAWCLGHLRRRPAAPATPPESRST